ncbi:MAG: hypothetical protein ACYSUY_20030 [Planctomycetota bacterium]|jgi:hypothetical protein
MFKDIFIDTDVINKFANPLDKNYKKLFKWLLDYDENNKNDNAYLAVSNKLRGEYSRSLRNSFSYSNNFSIIIDVFTKKGRFNSISNKKIKNFKQKYFNKKRIVRKLISSKNDRDHIPVVMLSDRKYALSLDGKFRRDINNFPGFSATAVKRPQDLPYDK